MEARTPGGTPGETRAVGMAPVRRFATETKQAFMTTEFWAMVGVIAALLIAAAIDDDFDARQAWLYVAIVAAAYLISRGLAKSGSREPYAQHEDVGARRPADTPR
jgi:hypothetical protein